MENRKKQRGDRKDAYLVRNADAMHQFMPYLIPNRADNEAVLNEKLDIGPALLYLQEKNKDEQEFSYTLFHFICAAVAKVMTLRPCMNYFYSGFRLYEKKDLTFAFVVKKKFADDAPETLAIIDIDRDAQASPIDQIHDKVKKIVFSVRKENKSNGATDTMDILKKLPRWLLRIVVKILNMLEYHGKLPQFFLDIDPYHASVFLSNLGSIKMNANYHHLANWGTNSFFVVIGEMHKHSFFDENGQMTLKDCVDLGLTIDERIADGVYFANSIKLLRKIFENPHLLDAPLRDEIDFK